MSTGARERQERVQWLELFFDLVVVAAVAVMTEGLREDASAEAIGLFLVVYGGIWFSWVSVVLYANVAGPTTHTRVVLAGMLLVAIMAASAPLHFEERANAFAIAFLALRAVTGGAAMRTGKLLASWPLLQLGGAAAPWFASFFVAAPWKFWLWGLGLVLDLAFVLWSRRPEATPEGMTVVEADPERLQERLGLFVIIVLGEVVAQIVVTASLTEWTRDFRHVAIAGFALIVGLWWLTFSYGFVGAPLARVRTMALRISLPLHLASTIGIVAVAAGLGEMAAHPEEPLAGTLRWVACGGLTLHIATMGLGGLASDAPRAWLVGWALPTAAFPLLVGVLDTRNGATVWLLVLPIVWMALYGRYARGSHKRASARSPA